MVVPARIWWIWAGLQRSYPWVFEGTSPTPDAMAGPEAAVKDCGVAAAMLPG
jgi:hypothetical protein